MRTYTTLARPIAVLGLTAFAVTACGDTTTPVAPVVPTAPSLAKGGPKMPPTNGRIYFTSSFAGNFDVYSMNPDGSDRRRLTSTVDGEHHLNVSKDGKKLVIGNRPTNPERRQLVTMNVDGTNRRVLLTNDASSAVAWPTFSPDGRTIAYVSTHSSEPNTFSIWSVSASGGKVTRLTPPTQSALYPSWSPDGTQIVYVGAAPGTQGFDLYIMNADGSGPQLLHECVDGCQFPVWTPDGSKIVYISRNVDGWQLQSCDLLKAIPVCGTQIAHEGLPTMVAVSPDGTQLVTMAQTWENTTVDRITTSNINGSAQTALTANLWAIGAVAWGR